MTGTTHTPWAATLPPGRVDLDGRVARPRSAVEVSRVCRAATEERLRIAVRGAGTWQAPTASDLTVSTSALADGPHLNAPDLVATVPSGMRVSDLQALLSEQGVWLAVDAPGPDRTVGSIIATGTPGPLSLGFGPVRDQVLGMTVVTGHGRQLTLGGQVVKNVAGFDLIRLMTGSFGAFGIITHVTLRVRALPAVTRTLRATLDLSTAVELTRTIAHHRLPVPACKVVSGPSGSSTLAFRLAGSEPQVAMWQDHLSRLCNEPFAVDDDWPVTNLNGDVTLRLSYQPSDLAQAMGCLVDHIPAGELGFTPRFLRITASVDIDVLHSLRRIGAERGWTVVVERAPESVLAAVGHYRRAEGPQRDIIDRLQRTFDPAGVLVHYLEAPE